LNLFPSPHSTGNKLARIVWKTAWLLLCRWTPRPFHAWRASVLSCFGAKLGRRTHIYPDARIWAPWNLECGDDACVGERAEVYNVARVTLGARAILSQESLICTATHDFRDPAFPLTSAPVRLGAKVWIAARSTVLPGLTLGEGCVIGAGSIVTKDMPAWAVCAGNPARVLRRNYHIS